MRCLSPDDYLLYYKPFFLQPGMNKGLLHACDSMDELGTLFLILDRD